MTRLVSRSAATRNALAVFVGFATVICLSSTWLAAILGGLTIATVAFDVMAHDLDHEAIMIERAARIGRSNPTGGEKLTVDLSRRQ